MPDTIGREWTREPVTVRMGAVLEACAIVGIEPVERGARLGIDPNLLAVLNEECPTLRIFAHAAGFQAIRPRLDFHSRFWRAVRLQPGADLLIIRRGRNRRCELLFGNALEAEEHIVQRTIVMIFPKFSRQIGAAFVNGPSRNDKSVNAFARAVGRLLHQVSGDDGCVHNRKSLVIWFHMVLRSSVVEESAWSASTDRKLNPT